MSYLITGTESVKLDIPLIAIPDNNGKHLLVRTNEGYEWKSFEGSTGEGSVDLNVSGSFNPVELDNEITNTTIAIQASCHFESLQERTYFINNGGFKIVADGFEYCLNGVQESIIILINNPLSVSVSGISRNVVIKLLQ